ncbi:MAG: PIN domain-containing protein [Anaerolineae bacterium]|nr:PIN domain-containing protein [Anaerolineae bacterium]
MLRLFLDASAIFAAAYSPTGAARELFALALRGQVQLLVNRGVLAEVERNLSRKAPEALTHFQLLMELIEPEILPDPEPQVLREIMAFVVAKDAIVIAGAVSGKADYLVTFDRRHLIDPPGIQERAGLPIVLPEVALCAVRQEQAGEDGKRA